MSTTDGGHYGGGMARRTRRLWTEDEKRSICLQAAAAGVSVAQVGLRYAVNANLIFKWLRNPRYGPAPEAGFASSACGDRRGGQGAPATPVIENRIEIVTCPPEVPSV